MNEEIGIDEDENVDEEITWIKVDDMINVGKHLQSMRMSILRGINTLNACEVDDLDSQYTLLERIDDSYEHILDEFDKMQCESEEDDEDSGIVL